MTMKTSKKESKEYECVYVPERAGHTVRFKHHKYSVSQRNGRLQCERCGKRKGE
jgi:hypothetical protein